jgi:hypothetical protein
MKPTAYLRLLFTIISLQLSSTLAAETPCDCTKFPFQPNPPCLDVCVAKNMAIASAEDLRDVFGLPDDLATVIAKITPNDRPRRLEDYKYLILGYQIGRVFKQGFEPVATYQAFEERVRSLKAEDFERVQKDALIGGMTVDKLQW